VAQDKLCPRCRAANPADGAFCEKCGASLAAVGADGAPIDPLIGTVVGDRFLVERRLGEGGMGVVYEAVQTAIGRKVALKVLHPHLADETLYARFRNEAAAASRLAHPNTITVFDFGRTGSGALYIAMELVEGTSLDEEIRTIGALDWQRTRRIAAQICGSLQHAHEHGIVHRDLKPENVMLLARGSETDVVKVLDFGIAKIVEEEGTDQRQALTKTGMVFGTPQYMSPEQIRGDRVDARSDVYSTGVILFRMLTGSLPFTAETLMGILTRHLMDPPPPFAQVNPAVQVPAALEGLVLQMLAKDPADRPQSMAEVAERMAALAAPIATTAPIAPIATTAPMPAVRPVKERKGKGGKIAGVVLAVLLLGAGGTTAWWFLAGPGRRPPRPPVTQFVMPPVAPPYVAPQYPATPPTAATGPATPPEASTAPLPALPRDADDDPGRATDPGEGAGKIKDKVKACSFVGGDDEVQNSVRDALKAKEAQIRACARGLTDEAAARFSFEVAANATRVSGLAAKTSTGLEECLKPHLAVSIDESDKKARTGDLTVTLAGRLGATSCRVQVATKVKGSTPKPEQPGEPGEGDKIKDELISAAKDKLGLLKKKLEEKMKGGKDGGT